MSLMTREHVVKLYNEFISQAGYQNKLSYFVKQFDVIFDLFPAFDPMLSYLNEPAYIELLTGMYKRDSIIYAGLKKEFRFGRQLLILDVRPVNSNRFLFNQFVVDGFLKSGDAFNSINGIIEQKSTTIEPAVPALFDESERQINVVLEYLQQKKIQNFRIQFMKVFYDGYNDQINGSRKTFKNKKKVIELYLYSQGILFAEYRLKLKSAWLQKKIQDNLTTPDDFKILDWRDQVMILKSMGILDVLKDRIHHPVETLKRKKIDRIICLIIGQQPYMADSITEFINLIE